MLTLGLDASGAVMGLALVEIGEEGRSWTPLAAWRMATHKQTAERMAPTLEALFRQARCERQDLGLVTVTVGPGSYTGLRVAVSTAKALGLAMDVPLVGLSTLHVLAEPLRFAPRTILPMLDSRMGEVCHARFRGGETVERLTEDRRSTPEEAVKGLESDAVLLGDGVLAYWERIQEMVPQAELAPEPYHYVNPEVVALLGYAKWREEGAVSPQMLQPVYLRDPQIGKKWRILEDK